MSSTQSSLLTPWFNHCLYNFAFYRRHITGIEQYVICSNRLL